eukprot:16429768-Heterocapsa_arctica.AAC.1
MPPTIACTFFSGGARPDSALNKQFIARSRTKSFSLLRSARFSFEKRLRMTMMRCSALCFSARSCQSVQGRAEVREDAAVPVMMTPEVDTDFLQILSFASSLSLLSTISSMRTAFGSVTPMSCEPATWRPKRLRFT